MMSKLLFMVLAMGILGFAAGRAIASGCKLGQSGSGKLRKTSVMDKATEKNLKQLQQQLNSGLISKKEYQKKRKELFEK